MEPTKTEVKFIGIGFRKQSGKDTFANVLCEYLPDSVICSFATPLKHYCMEVYGLTREQCWGTDEQKNTLTRVTPRDIGMPPDDNTFLSARSVLQHVGVTMRESFHVDVWAWVPFMVDWGYTKFVIIPDVRFENEARLIQDHGGELLHLKRPGSPDDTHISECALQDWKWDRVVSNDGDLARLRRKGARHAGRIQREWQLDVDMNRSDLCC